MTATHHTTAEIAKLARVLELSDPAELDFLAELPPAAIRAFRDQVGDLISRREARRMQRIGAAAKLVPAAVAAKVTESAFGPVLAAAVAGSVDPARAVAIAGSLSPAFLADATVTLDPHRATDVIAHVPTKMAAAVARELIRRGDYLTMGRLAGSVPDAALRAALPHAADIDLLHVGYYLEDTSAADRLLAIVADRIPGMLRATHTEGQWAEAITLLDLLGPAERSRIGDLAAAQDDELIDGLLTAVEELDAWDTLLPVAAGMTPTSLHRLAQRPLLHNPDTLGTILTTTAGHNLWPQFLPLLDALPAETHPALATTIATLTDDQFQAALTACPTSDSLPTLLDLVLRQDDAARARSLTLLDNSPDLESLIAALPATETPMWERLRDLRTEIPTRTMTLLATRAAQCGLTDISDQLTA
ncbi:hypothetical protein ACFVVM_27220 [Nocardia sp. NPDC058176]|uniref:hypothetical protein n=1 Tax=Nocardia sp. NPDC058176 TaxID=3346368 RepID=UPI0036D82612